jgi:hypothetical protein
MMIVIGPAKTQPFLSLILHAGRMVATLPILALGLKEQVAGPRPADVVRRGGEQLRCDLKPADHGRIAIARAERIQMTLGGSDLFAIRIL